MKPTGVVAARGVTSQENTLVGAEWLATHCLDPDVRVVEVDVSRAAYDDWHIDGAILWNIYADLKDSDYRLLEHRGIKELLDRSGITPGSTVVFYGYAPALGFWLMRLYGHQNVRILDCSRDAWRAEGHPWNRDVATPTPTDYHLGEADPSLRASGYEVARAIGQPTTALVDVRSQAEYRGERFWPSGATEPNGRAGHIPTAVHRPIDGLYDGRGALRPPDQLRRIFSTVDVDGETDLIIYCTIGGRAATAWFVLTFLLERDRVRIYDGSWAEWGRAADTPVEIGEATTH